MFRIRGLLVTEDSKMENRKTFFVRRRVSVNDKGG